MAPPDDRTPTSQEASLQPEPGPGRGAPHAAATGERTAGGLARAIRQLYVTIIFVIVSSFFLGNPMVEALDIVFGLLILADFPARLFISRSRFGMLVHPLGIADVIVILSFLVPTPGENFGFLRVVRALRLFRSYRLVARLQRDFAFFKRNQDAVFSVVNLFVFILVMTALVHASQFGRNPEISNYPDALYFTVTTLTTTGFGDITMGTRRAACWRC